MYKNPEKIQWQLVTLEKAQFILQESKELLSELDKDYEYIDSKIASTRNFLIVGIAAMVSTLSFAKEPFLTSMVVLIAGFCISLGFLIFASQTEKKPVMGRPSESLLGIDYIKGDLCFLILGYLASHNDCVKASLTINLKKGTLYNFSLFVILITSIIASTIIAYKYFL